MKTNAALLHLVALPLAQAISVAYYEKEGCRGKILGHDNFSDGPKCWTPSALALGSRSVKATDWNSDDEDGYYYHSRHDDEPTKLLRFYSSPDCSNSCNDRHVLGHTEWRDCISWPAVKLTEGTRMLSFDIVESGETGAERSAVLSDGACPALAHGDQVRIHGEPFKMQQVAATLFRDVPLREWDEAVHIRNTTNRFAQHRDVDAFGKHKFSYYHGWMDKIRLEYWQEKEHGFNTYEENDYYDYDYDDHDWYEEVAEDVERVCEAYAEREEKSESLEQFKHICAPKETKKQLKAFKKASIKFTKFAGKKASEKLNQFVGDVQEVIGKTGL